MIEIINGKAYVKKGDKVYELGGGSNIITADSVEQLPDPASVPEGTIALVKCEENVFDLTAMGFPVVAEIGKQYSLATDTTEIYKAFTEGSVDFSFEFMMAGNKVVVHTGSVNIVASNLVSGSTIVFFNGTWIVANIAVTSTLIVMNTKVLA
jgi:hypothetical protein